MHTCKRTLWFKLLIYPFNLLPASSFGCPFNWKYMRRAKVLSMCVSVCITIDLENPLLPVLSPGSQLYTGRNNAKVHRPSCKNTVILSLTYPWLNNRAARIRQITIITVPSIYIVTWRRALLSFYAEEIKGESLTKEPQSSIQLSRVEGRFAAIAKSFPLSARTIHKCLLSNSPVGVVCVCSWF